jgi:hypothetical protein
MGLMLLFLLQLSTRITLAIIRDTFYAFAVTIIIQFDMLLMDVASINVQT